MAETVKNISESSAFKKVSEGVKVAKDVVQEELNESDIYVRGQVYQRPRTLQKRSDRLMHSMAQVSHSVIVIGIPLELIDREKAFLARECDVPFCHGLTCRPKSKLIFAAHPALKFQLIARSA